MTSRAIDLQVDAGRRDGAKIPDWSRYLSAPQARYSIGEGRTLRYLPSMQALAIFQNPVRDLAIYSDWVLTSLSISNQAASTAEAAHQICEKIEWAAYDWWDVRDTGK
jgi:hypothetical protein